MQSDGLGQPHVVTGPVKDTVVLPDKDVPQDPQLGITITLKATAADALHLGKKADKKLAPMPSLARWQTTHYPHSLRPPAPHHSYSTHIRRSHSTDEEIDIQKLM